MKLKGISTVCHLTIEWGHLVLKRRINNQPTLTPTGKNLSNSNYNFANGNRLTASTKAWLVNLVQKDFTIQRKNILERVRQHFLPQKVPSYFVPSGDRAFLAVILKKSCIELICGLGLFVRPSSFVGTWFSIVFII